ncbi:RCC1 domain-containing protein [Archangium gephyra]|uniref:RCC1 domain-containing protein n=1 Tax=Archangium gephyra TaxID=48 RepID=UPI003B7D6677
MLLLMSKSAAFWVSFVALGLTACVDTSAVAVGDFKTPVQQLVLGTESACVLDANNELWCWGAPWLFPGVPIESGPAVDCISPFVEVGGGGGFGTCVTPGPLPVELRVSGKLVDVVVGSGIAFALTSEDEIYAWPVRIDGCVGGRECTGAVLAASGLGITELVAYQGGWCGLTARGTAYCQHLVPSLGVTNDFTHLTPTPIPGGHVIKSLAIAGPMYFVLDDTGHLWRGWFTRDTSASREHYVPAEALPWLPGETFTAVSLSNGSATFDTPPANIPGCALSTTGAVWCWGWNELGQHGDGTFKPLSSGFPAPSKALLPAPAVEVSVGLLHTCALSEDGRVFCWGANFSSALGYTPDSTCSLPAMTISCSAMPTELTSLPPSRRLRVSSHYSCAEAMDGSILCWGINNSAQLGRVGVDGRTPVRVNR